MGERQRDNLHCRLRRRRRASGVIMLHTEDEVSKQASRPSDFSRVLGGRPALNRLTTLRCSRWLGRPPQAVQPEVFGKVVERMCATTGAKRKGQ